MTRRQWRSAALAFVAAILERAGIIDGERFRPTMELAWPRIVTGFAIMSKQTADPRWGRRRDGRHRGLAFALQVTGRSLRCWGSGSRAGQSRSSRRTTAARRPIARRWPSTSVVLRRRAVGPDRAPSSSPFRAPDPPARLRIGRASSTGGSTSSTSLAPAVVFEVLNLIASRTHTGVGDTFTEMVARAGGAVLNVVLSGLLIFGFGLGAAGVAIGTTLASGFVTVVLAGMPVVRPARHGTQPRPDHAVGPMARADAAAAIDRGLAAGDRPPARTGARRLPAAVDRRLRPRRRDGARGRPTGASADQQRQLGLSLAASSLVGQHLGADEEGEAGAYGAAIIRLSTVLYVVIGALVVIFARPIAGCS